MLLKHIEAFGRNGNAPIVGQTLNILIPCETEQEVEFYLNYAKTTSDNVILPFEYSIEQYYDLKTKIASYCVCKNANRLEKTSQAFVQATYECKQRCKVLNMYVEGKKIFVDIETLENMLLEDKHKEIREEILENFKEYLKWDNIKLKYIQKIKNTVDFEEFIYLVSMICKLNLNARRDVLQEEDSLKRLQILNKELKFRIYEQKNDRNRNMIDFYKEKIDDINMPIDVKFQVYDELFRLKTNKIGTSNYANIVDFLERVISLPWNKQTEDNNDIDLAIKILNESHYGMNILKEKIIDYIAIKMISNNAKMPILCLYGPPGVGKTSICKAIAKALNKKLYSISLAGISYPEELNGMKRFYVGAKPGKIMEAIEYNKSENGIILLDEIDKMRTDSSHGNPYGVLLEAFDKNQNTAFKDKFYDIPYDISKIMFITTANDLSTIPEPVLSRMEILNIEGYSENEKVHIGKEYLLPKILMELGFEKDFITISDELMMYIIEKSTFESGVRQLERSLENICRKYIINLKLKNLPFEKHDFTKEEVDKYIKSYNFDFETLAKDGEIGVVNSLSVVGANGLITRLEISVVEGNGTVVTSNNIVGTTRGTFTTIMGLIKSRYNMWGIDKKMFKENSFYVHYPHHEIEVDGPSGGIAGVVCMLSAIKNVPVSADYAFTGEISLKGEILPVGGLKSKLLAAQRSKIKKVILPLKNKVDVEELSSEIISGLEIIYVDNIDEVYKEIFIKNK